MCRISLVITDNRQPTQDRPPSIYFGNDTTDARSLGTNHFCRVTSNDKMVAISIVPSTLQGVNLNYFSSSELWHAL